MVGGPLGRNVPDEHHVIVQQTQTTWRERCILTFEACRREESTTCC
jgi:hypothetical protein